MLPVILASPAFPNLSILSHTYPYLSGSFHSPLVVPRFVRNSKLFLTSPCFARLTLLSRIFQDHPFLLRVGPGFSRMSRLFQFPPEQSTLSTLLPDYPACTGLLWVFANVPGCFDESKVVPCPSWLFYIVPDRDRTFCASPDGPRSYQISFGFLCIPRFAQRRAPPPRI